MKTILSLALFFTLSTQATETILLNSSEIDLGYMGDIRYAKDISDNGAYELVRVPETPKKVRLTYSYKGPENYCAQTRTVWYQCGFTRGPFFYSRRAFFYNPYYFDGMNICTYRECARYETRYVTKFSRIKLNFRKANALGGTENERIDLRLFSTRSTVDFSMSSDSYKRLRVRGNTVKFGNFK